MTDPVEQWAYLGQCLRAERGGRSREKIEELSGVSATMIQRYERGKVHTDPPDKLWQLARFYRWTPDSISRVLAGELPKYLPPPDISEAARERIAKAIAEHPTLPEDEKRELSRLLLPNGA
jgi:transcriptional regulator with XRE-family HTH domain